LQELGFSERRIAVEEKRLEHSQIMDTLNYKLAENKAKFDNAKSEQQAQVYGAQAEVLQFELEQNQNKQYGVELENAVGFLRESDDAGFNNFLESNQEIIQQAFAPTNGAAYSSIKVMTDPQGGGGVAQFYDDNGDLVGSDPFTYDELMSTAKGLQGETGNKNLDSLTKYLTSTASVIRDVGADTEEGKALLRNFGAMQQLFEAQMQKNASSGQQSNTAGSMYTMLQRGGKFLVQNRATREIQEFNTLEEAEDAMAGGPVPVRGLTR
jgi:hypothetical protein